MFSENAYTLLKKNMLRRTRINVRYDDQLSVNLVLFAERVSFLAKMKYILVLLVMCSLCCIGVIWFGYFISSERISINLLSVLNCIAGIEMSLFFYLISIFEQLICISKYNAYRKYMHWNFSHGIEIKWFYKLSDLFIYFHFIYKLLV